MAAEFNRHKRRQRNHSASEAVFIYTCTRSHRYHLLYVCQEHRKERYRYDTSRLCSAYVRYGVNVRRSFRIKRSRGLYKSAHGILKSYPRSSGRRTADSNNTEFICFGRYTSGTVNYRRNHLRFGNSYHYGTEYRYMCYSINIICRRKQKRQACCVCTPVFQYNRYSRTAAAVLCS